MLALRQRTVYHRDKALRELARGAPCQVEFPLMRGHSSPETTVWAHSNQGRHGKGKSIKAHDCFGFFACHTCHSAIDQGGRVSRAERESVEQHAMVRTRQWLLVHDKLEFRPLTTSEALVVTLDDDLWLIGWQNGHIRVKR